MELYTRDMFELFKTRTDRHIQFFDDCMRRLKMPQGDHDRSKYREPELTGYVLLTWSKSCPDSFLLDEGQQKLVDNAIQTHLLSNPHHPEFWDRLAYVNKQIIRATEMDVFSLQEMTCDWAAMSLEFGDNAAEFAKNNIGRRWLFNHEQEDLIYRWLNQLGYRLESSLPAVQSAPVPQAIPKPPHIPEREYDRAMNNHPTPEKENAPDSVC